MEPRRLQSTLVRLIGLLATSALVLAGCGSDDDSGSGGNEIETISDGMLTVCSYTVSMPSEYPEGDGFAGALPADHLDRVWPDTGLTRIV